MIEQNTSNPNPEVRTTDFFDMDVHKLADELKGRKLILQEEGKYIVPTEVQVFGRDENQGAYAPMREMQAGSLWIMDYPFRRTVLPLIVAKDSGEVGACVRIVSALTFDQESKSEKPIQKQKDLVEYLGLNPNEVVRLSFKDQTDSLFITREEVNKSKPRKITSKEADEVLRRAFS